MTITFMHSKDAQRADALKLANRRRIACAEFKQDIAELDAIDGARRLADFIEADLPDQFQSMRVVNALMAVRSIGDLKARAMLRACDVGNSGRYLRDLTQRQRFVLAEELRYFADRCEALRVIRADFRRREGIA